MPRPCQPLRGLLSQVVSNQSGGAVTQLRLDVKEHTVTAKYRTESSGTLSLYPFFFVKAENGSLLEVLHHPDETSESLGVKKVLVSSHQLVVPSRQFRSTSGDSERWEVAEEDASGGSRANYTSRRGLFGRTHYHKQQEWPSKESGLVQLATTDAVVGRNGELVRLETQRRLLFEDLTLRFGDIAVGAEKLNYLLPPEPSAVTWSLLTPSSPQIDATGPPPWYVHSRILHVPTGEGDAPQCDSADEQNLREAVQCLAHSDDQEAQARCCPSCHVRRLL